MNLQDPVSTIMTTSLLTVSLKDKLQAAKDIFGTHQIHHIPVVVEGKLKGILSKTDYLYYMRPHHRNEQDRYTNEFRLGNYTIEEVMTKHVITVYPTDKIKTALEILSENLFHALPVVENGKLVGMVTTHDIVYELLYPKRMLTD